MLSLWEKDETIIIDLIERVWILRNRFESLYPATGIYSHMELENISSEMGLINSQIDWLIFMESEH